MDTRQGFLESDTDEASGIVVSQVWRKGRQVAGEYYKLQQDITICRRAQILGSQNSWLRVKDPIMQQQGRM